MELQQILNKCVELWRSYRRIYKKTNIIYCDDWIINKDQHEDDSISYHELFSVDSWLMEFVDWTKSFTKEDWTKSNYLAYDDMSCMTAQKKVEYFIHNAIIPWSTK